EPETGEPLLQITIPVFRFRTGKIHGYLVGILRLKPIWDLLSRISLARDYDVFILDDRNRVVAHSNPSVVLRGTVFTPPGKTFAGGISHKRAVISGDFMTIGTQTFTVMVEHAQKGAFAVSIRTIILNALLVALVLAMALVLFRMLSVQLVRPVAHLAEVARAIEKGDLSRRAELRRSDEIGMLTAAFNRMTDRISRFVSDLNREIRERRETEAALRISQDKYRKVAENLELFRLLIDRSHDVITVVDPETGRILDVNLTACIRLGYDREDLEGNDICNIDPDFRDRPDWTTSRDRNRQNRFEIRHSDYQCREGHLMPVEISTTFVRHGDRSYLVNVARDVTERKNLEESLRQSHKMEAVGTLAGGIAHDFNNILGIVVGNAELALEDIPETKPVHRSIKEIFTASLRARDMVRQLLSFARKTAVEKRPISLGPVVEEAVQLLRSSTPAYIDIHTDIDPGLLPVVADATQISQIVINLGTNAVHAMPGGGALDISVSDVSMDSDTRKERLSIPAGRYVELCVRDTGQGIPKDNLERIFDPYFTTKEVGKGTGMGLAVIHGIVQDHGGLVGVESRVGKGTTFRILFPVTGEDKTDLPISPARRAESGQGEQILCIDDEESIVRMTESMLTRLGYRVKTAIDPFAGLAMLQKDPDEFDLIITDMSMPGLTGDRLVEAVHRIRPGLPVLLCSGFSERLENGSIQNFGAAAYLEKPVEKNALAKAVRTVLNASEKSGNTLDPQPQKTD
ncbi:MAG: ATP-binding protein, partial [Desulfobacterales bacterium]|nr:ATP-binding protein [Desulfobacterales bacterium]